MTNALKVADVAELLETEGIHYVSAWRLAKQIAGMFESVGAVNAKPVIAVNINEVES